MPVNASVVIIPLLVQASFIFISLSDFVEHSLY